MTAEEKQQAIESFDSNKFLLELQEGAQLKILKILADTLTGKEISVESGSNASANMTTGTDLTVPKKLSKFELIDWLLKKGMTLHEIFHLLYSGIIKEAVNEYWKKDPTFNPVLFKEIVNVLEDARIEYLGIRSHEGSTELIAFQNLWALNKFRTERPEQLKESKLLALCFRLKGIDIPESDETVDLLYKIAKDVVFEDWEGCVKKSKEVYDVFSKMKGTESQEDKGLETQPSEYNEFNSSKGKQSNKSLKKDMTEKEQKEMRKKVEKENKELSDKMEDSDSEKKLEEQLKKDFKSEFTTNQRIQKQLKQEAEEMVSRYKKEIEECFRTNVLFQLPPKHQYTKHFNVSESESVAHQISNVLRGKLVIGEQLYTRQLSGKMNINDAVKSVVNHEVTGEFDEHIFEREEIQTPRHSVILLLDVSGSMDNHRAISKACEGCFVLGKVFESLGVDFSIRGFSDGTDYMTINGKSKQLYGVLDIMVKGWDERVNPERFFSLKPISATPTAEATRNAVTKLLQRDTKLKILFTVTDGFPDDEELLIQEVKDARDKGIKVVGIYIGYVSPYIRGRFEKFYGKDFIAIDDIGQLKGEILKTYERILSEVKRW
jgi:hypothetical protein